jgi:hypothetical protein
LEVDFEKWLKVMIFHCPFKILEKIIVRGSWSRNHKIFIAKPAGSLCAILPRHRSRTRCQKPGRNSRFLNFGIKCREI